MKNKKLSVLIGNKGSDVWQDCNGPIYVSFSAQLFLQYGFNVDTLSLVTSSKKLPSSIVAEIKTLLLEEWTKANIKIIFTDSKITNYMDKNLVFIFPSTTKEIHTICENCSGVTSPYIETKNGPAILKVIFFDALLLNPNLRNLFKLTLLHETGHAFIGARHVLPNEIDEGITCADTVMAYPKQCSWYHPTMKKEGIPLTHTLLEAEWTDPTKRKFLQLINDKALTQLGPVDLATAEQYKNNCHKKNGGIPQNSHDSGSPSADKKELIVFQFAQANPPTFGEKLNFYTQQFGLPFSQAFFATLIDRYIQPALLSADYNKNDITNLCAALKLALSALHYGMSYSVMNHFLQVLLPASMRKLGFCEQSVSAATRYFFPIMTIILSFKEMTLLDNLLNTFTVVTANEAGKQFAYALIHKLPKLKQEEKPEKSIRLG